MAQGYIIKTKFITGNHAGAEYYLARGGRVTKPDGYHFDWEVYKRLADAKRVCTIYRKGDEVCRRAFVARDIEEYTPFHVEY